MTNDAVNPPPEDAAPPPVVYETAPAYTPPPPPAVQREVVYPNGRYVLYGDGVRQAFEEPLRVIINTIKDTLERTPPELAADIAERGIMLAGGGSLLKGFEARVAAETKMTTSLADSPLTCVVIGSGRSLEEFEVMGRAGRDSGHRRLRRR